MKKKNVACAVFLHVYAGGKKIFFFFFMLDSIYYIITSLYSHREMIFCRKRRNTCLIIALLLCGADQPRWKSLCSSVLQHAPPRFIVVARLFSANRLFAPVDAPIPLCKCRGSFRMGTMNRRRRIATRTDERMSKKIKKKIHRDSRRTG